MATPIVSGGVAASASEQRGFSPAVDPHLTACLHCGKVFDREGTNRRLCSDECRRERLRIHAEARTFVSICSVCGREVVCPHKRRYCSDDCRARGGELGVRQCKPRFFLVVKCVGCGEPYKKTHRSQRYCTPACREAHQTPARLRAKATMRVHQKMREYRKRAAQQNPMGLFPSEAIFDRDNWRCQRCGRSCRNIADPNDSRAPTLDHIIPLSRGGLHTPSNTQLLCRSCNSAKKSAVGGDQLRLPIV